MPTESTGRAATLSAALNTLDMNRLYDALRVGLATLPDALDTAHAEDRPEDLYHAIMRQAEVAKVLWALSAPGTLPKSN